MGLCSVTANAAQLHSILELGMLGTGIPSAIGSKLGAPERDVVCVTGDGAAGFNIMEMQTAARERLAITTVVRPRGVGRWRR
nr:thiamine pyrophosphate-dependent enzyme [Candidatus Microthrix sp.]